VEDVAEKDQKVLWPGHGVEPSWTTFVFLELLQFLPSLSGCVILRFKGDKVEFKWRCRNIYNRIRCIDNPETRLSRDSMKKKTRRDGEISTTPGMKQPDSVESNTVYLHFVTIQVEQTLR
jgi:hypothetical protein